jgi:hypothetical protein
MSKQTTMGTWLRIPYLAALDRYAGGGRGVIQVPPSSYELPKILTAWGQRMLLEACRIRRRQGNPSMPKIPPCCVRAYHELIIPPYLSGPHRALGLICGARELLSWVRLRICMRERCPCHDGRVLRTSDRTWARLSIRQDDTASPKSTLDRGLGQHLG